MSKYGQISLSDYWRIIRRRMWVVIFVFLVVILGSVMYTLSQPPVYQATADVKVEAYTTLSEALTTFFQYTPADIMATSSALVTSHAVLKEAAKRLGLISKDAKNKEIDEAVETVRGMLSAEPIEMTNILHIMATSSNPRYAASVANVVAQTFRDLDIEEKNKKTTEALRFIESELKIAKASLEEKGLTTEESKSREETYTLLNKSYKEAQIAAAGRIETVSIVNPAIIPTSPTQTSRELNVTIGGLIGLILGFVSAFVVENMDTSIAKVEEVEDFLKIPVLGIIPHIRTAEEIKKPSRKSKHREEIPHLRSQLTVHYKPKSYEAESYRSLMANIEFALLGEEKKTFLFTSSVPREGKSLTVANCALASAQMGKKTLLVSADLRRPVIHNLFGLPREPGLSDILVNNAKWQDCLKNVNDMLVGELPMEDLLRTPGIDNLYIINAGHIPPNPTEMLNSKQMKNLLDELKSKFDYIFIDCSPILPTADSSLLGPKVDGTVLIYQVGKVARGALRRAKIQLDQAKAKVIGIVLNDIRAAEREPGTSHYYYDRYYDESKKEGLRKRLFKS